jgi:hypothetical protein
VQACKQETKVLLITGTPVINDTDEAASLLELVNPSASKNLRKALRRCCDADADKKCKLVFQQLLLNGKKLV